MSAKRFTIRLAVTVDPDEWREEYGTDETIAQIMQSLRYSITDAARSSVQHLTCVEVSA